MIDSNNSLNNSETSTPASDKSPTPSRPSRRPTMKEIKEKLLTLTEITLHQNGIITPTQAIDLAECAAEVNEFADCLKDHVDYLEELERDK